MNIPRVVFKKLRPDSQTATSARVYFGDVDVSKYIASVEVKLEAGKRPTLVMTSPYVEIDTDYPDVEIEYPNGRTTKDED